MTNSLETKIPDMNRHFGHHFKYILRELFLIPTCHIGVIFVIVGIANVISVFTKVISEFVIFSQILVLISVWPIWLQCHIGFMLFNYICPISNFFNGKLLTIDVFQSMTFFYDLFFVISVLCYFIKFAQYQTFSTENY